MMFLGTAVNCLTIAVGSLIGLLFNKGIPQRVGDQLMKALGLCTLLIGIQGALKGENALIMILSMALGVLLGELIDLDRHFNRLLQRVEARFSPKAGGKHSLAEGFTSSSLLFCIGSMTLVGAINAGVSGDQTMLYTKAMLDLCSSLVFASTLGIGVLFSVAFVAVYQGGLTLLAHFAAPLLQAFAINEMTCVGSLLIIGTGLNLLGITKLKLLNFLPAMFLPLLFCLFL
ncbi:MAG: DUF554 domain-containing protein [Oscillospiraceae bacterium]|nr:DUF554 domain-containing protein [Oscillospiraceae bacterium]